MKKIALLVSLSVMCASAFALEITSIVPNQQVCDNTAIVQWSGAPTSGVKLITFSFANYKEVWKIYDPAQGATGSYNNCKYDPDQNPETLTIKMFSSTDMSQTPIATASKEFNNYPYAISQNLYYDFCSTSITLQMKTQRPVSQLKNEYMVAELYEKDGITPLQRIEQTKSSESNFIYHFTGVKYDSGKEYYTKVYAVNGSGGQKYNLCGERTSEVKKITGNYNLYINGAKAVVTKSSTTLNAIEINYTGDAACTAVGVQLQRTDSDGNVEYLEGFTYEGGSAKTFTDSTAAKCKPYSYKLVAFDAAGNVISQSNASDNVSITEHPEFIVDFSDTRATLAEYADKVMLQWTLTNYTKVTQVKVKRAISTNPTQFNTVSTLNYATQKNSFVDNTVKVGTYYLYCIEVTNTDNCIFTSPVVPGFASATATVTGRVTYADNMGTPGVQVSAKLADESAFISQGSLRSYDRSVGYVQFTDALTPDAFTWQGWIKTSSPSKSVIYRQKGVFRIVAEDNTVTVTSDDNDMKPLLSTNVKNLSEYTHATFVFTGDSGLIYIDGALKVKNAIKLSGETTSEAYFLAADSACTAGANANLDDVRLWNKALGADQINLNYLRILAGDEDGLYSYWKFDEQGISCFVDYAHKATMGYNGNHGIILGSNTYSTDVPAGLSCMGYSDESGYYKIPGIPISSDGVTYSIVPYKDGAIFSPTESRYMFDQYNAIGQNINFTDNSSYQVYVHVMYKGTKVPVKGVNISIDGTLATTNDANIETDKEGYASISVSKGEHTIALSKSGHTFSAIVGEGGGSYKGSFHADVEKAYAIELSDSTQVKVCGRIAGGKEEGEKAVGFGESKNNIGVSEMVLRFKDADLATCALFDDTRTEETKTYETKKLESFWVDKPHYAATPANTTKITKRKNGNVWEWVIVPDATSGEYISDLYPEEYEVISIKYYSQPGGGKLDYSASFTPLVDTLGTNTQSLTKDYPVLDYKGQPIGLPDSTYTTYQACDYLQNYLLYNTPQIAVWQENADGGKYFGSRTYTVSGTEVELYTSEGKYTVYKKDPVFIQGQQYTLNVQSKEVYYASADVTNEYTFNGGTFTVLNEFGNIDGEFTVTGSGIWQYRFIASTPRFDTGDYRKHLKVYLTSDGVDYYWHPDLGTGNDQCINNEMPGVIVGALSDNSSKFVTKGPDVTAFVLRDPPGNGSYSTLSAGTTYSFSYSEKDSNGADGTRRNSKGSWYLTMGGQKGSKTIEPVAPSLSVVEHYSVKGGGGTKLEWETYDYTTKSYTYTSQVSTEINSSNSVSFMCSSGDVYVGNSLNYIFTDSRHLDIKLEEGSPELYEFKKIDALDSIGTQFQYTQFHIVSNLIPSLEAARDSMLVYDANPAEHTAAELFASYPESVTELYLTSYKKGDASYGTLGSYTPYYRPNSGTHSDAVAYNIQSIDNWEKTIAANETTKLDAINGGSDWTKQNYSFDGSHISTNQVKFTFKTDEKRTRGFKFYVGLTGSFDLSVKKFWLKTELNATFRRDAEFISSKDYMQTYTRNVDLGDGGDDYRSEESVADSTFTGELTLAYTLYDLNVKNKYSVDVYIPKWASEKALKLATNKDSLDEQIYNLAMPVFILRAGTTSCNNYTGDKTLYYKAGTQLNAATTRGEDPQILIGGSKIQTYSNIDPDAVIPVELQVSEKSEDPASYNYNMRYTSTTGAVVLNPDIYNQIPQPVNGPVTFYAYLNHTRKDITTDSIGIIAYSHCQAIPNYYGKDQIADTAWVHVSYLPVAPVPSLNYTSRSNVVNIGNDSVDIKISEYGAGYKNLTDLVLEYRGENDVQWQTKYYFALTQKEYDEQQSMYPDKIRLVEGLDSINYTFRFTESDGDGKYLTRVRADVKSNGVVLDTKYSDTIELIKDVTAPYVISTSPSDGIMSIGENIGLDANEDLYITSIISDKISIGGVLNGQIDKEGNDRGLQFDGSSMNAKTAYQYNFYDRSFTVDTWVWYNGTPGVIYSQGRSGDAWFELAVNDNNNLEIRILQSGKTSTYTLGETLKSNQWTYIAAVYDNANERVDFYQSDAVGAEQVDERGFNKNVTPYEGYTQSYNAVGPLYLASDVEGAKNFAGKLRDFRLWNKALKPSEILANRSVLLSGSEIGLLGYWRLNELDGNTAADKAQSHTLEHNATWFLHPGGYAMTTTLTDTLQFTSPGLEVQDYTLEFWFKSKGETEGYLFKRMSDDVLSLFVSGGNLVINAGNIEKSIDGGSYLDGSWHHVAIASSHYGEAEWFIDGKKVYSCLASEAGSLDAKFIMGAGVATSIDNVRVWKQALDGVALGQVMHTRSAATDDLADYYPFDIMNELNTELITTTRSIAGAQGKVDILSAIPQDSTAFFTAEAAMVDAKTNVEKIVPTVVREQRGMTLSLDEFDTKPYRLQDCELTVTVNKDAIQDLHGNYMNSSKQWSVFVDNKRIVWDVDEIEDVKAAGEQFEFSATFNNRYGQTQNFSIENLPSWLCASVDFGTIKPLATQKVKFTVDASLPVGDYEEPIYLRGDGNLVDILTLKLKVRAEAPEWSADCSDAENSTRIIARVKVDGYYPECEENMLGAFVDGTCVGVVNYSKAAGGFYMLNICPQATDIVEYRYWDATTGTLYTKLTPNKEIGTGIVGLPSDPVEFAASNDISAQVPLRKGYNWVSINVNADNATDIPALFEHNNGVTSIKNQIGQIAIRENGESLWFVTLPEVEPSQMYSVVSTSDEIWQVDGKAVNPADVNITVRGSKSKMQWSWIGYTPAVSMSVTEAMSLHTPMTGDAIASKEAFAVYDSIYGWVGTLISMEPGKGYKYYSSQKTTFVYPSVTAAKRVAKASATNSHFIYDPYDYSSSMSIFAVVKDYTIKEGDEIGWFVGSECRGGAVAIAYGEGYIFSGQIYADADGESVTARLFDSATQQEESISNVTTFKADEVQGTPSNPVVYIIGPVSASEATADGADMPYKVIIDNQVFIISGDKMYDLLGIER